MDGVVCCMRALPSGRAEIVPVPEEHPLAECRNCVACHRLDNAIECEGDGMESFYARLGIVILGTVMNGDCGIDTACMMVSLPRTVEHRNALRQEMADYLLDRAEQPWMHTLLVVCQGLDPVV